MIFPESVQINAWADGEVRGRVDPELRKHILGLEIEARSGTTPAEIVSKEKWKNEEVGWGLVLPENLTMPAAKRATPEDAPAPIRELHAARGWPEFRAGEDWTPRVLRRYVPDGSVLDAKVGAEGLKQRNGACAAIPLDRWRTRSNPMGSSV